MVEEKVFWPHGKESTRVLGEKVQGRTRGKEPRTPG